MKPFLSRHRTFLCLLGLFLVLRLLQVSSSLVSFDDEDGFTMSAVAQLFGDGQWPWYAYQISDWEGGSLVIVLLTIPFYLLLGPSLFALQAAGVLVAAMTMTGLYLLCRHSYGRHEAHLASLLYACFPGPLLQYSMVAHGFHPDSAMLQVLFLWTLTRALDGPGAPSARRYLLAGVLGGLAVYYAYIAAITVAAGSLVLGWRLLRRRAFSPLLPYAAGLALGVAPLLAYNLATGFTGVGMDIDADTSQYGRTFFDYVNPEALGHRLAFFYREGADAVLYFSNYNNRGDLALTGFNLLYWAAALFALALPFARRRSFATTTTDLAVCGAALLTTYVFCTAAHPLGPQHVAPILVLLIPPLAARAVALWDGGGRAIRAALLTGLCYFAGFGLAEGLSLVRPGLLGVSLHVDGRSDPQFYQQMKLKSQIRGAKAQYAAMDRAFLALPLERARVRGADETYLDHRVYQNSKFTGITVRILTRDPAGTLFNPLTEEGAWQRLMETVRRPGQPAQVYAHAGFLLASRALADPALPRRDGDDPGPRMRRLRQVIGGLIGRLSLRQRRALLQGVGFGLAEPELGALLTPKSWSMADARLIALGHGRAVGLVRLLLSNETLCGREVPAAYREFYAMGVGAGLGCRVIGSLPDVVTERVCPALRSAVALGYKTSPCRKLKNH